MDELGSFKQELEGLVDLHVRGDRVSMRGDEVDMIELVWSVISSLEASVQPYQMMRHTPTGVLPSRVLHPRTVTESCRGTRRG